MRRNTIITILLALALGVSSANAMPTLVAQYTATGVFGNQAPPNYGLRLDGFYGGGSSAEVTFSFDDVTFDVYDIGAAHLHGVVSVAEYNNSGTDGGFTHSYALDVWFEETTGSNASWDYYMIVGDSGTEMTSLDDAANDFAELVSYPFDGSKPFQVGYGANEKNGNFGAAGWVNYEHNYFGDTYGSLTGEHLYSSDFLMDLTPVPEPTTMLLFGLGLAGAGVTRRLRKKA